MVTHTLEPKVYSVFNVWKCSLYPIDMNSCVLCSRAECQRQGNISHPKTCQGNWVTFRTDWQLEIFPVA